MPYPTSNGHGLAPEPIRRQMRWKPGDAPIVDLEEGVVSVRTAPEVDDLVGVLLALAR